MNNIHTISAAITFAIAVLGAALGILNTWRAFDRDKIRIRVSPRWAISYWGSEMTTRFCLEITNLSYIPITIDQVGFDLRKPKAHILFFIPEFIDGGKIPRRLEPRSSFTAYAPAGTEEKKSFADVKCAFAKTACGVVSRGTSPALKGQIKKMKKLSA